MRSPADGSGSASSPRSEAYRVVLVPERHRDRVEQYIATLEDTDGAARDDVTESDGGRGHGAGDRR